MPVTEITKDLDARSLVVTAEFAAPLERVWQVYADPRQLERVWGPPGFPSTVVEHSLVPGGRMHYYMTSPEGERFYGGWRVLEVEVLSRFLTPGRRIWINRFSGSILILFGVLAISSIR